MKRTDIRKYTFKLLYLSDFYSGDELETQIDNFFEDKEDVNIKDITEIRERVNSVLSNVDTIDEALNKSSVNWKVDRMSKVDKAILRLAYYEISMDEGVPDKVAINEAVELAKKYSSDNSPAFVNGILSYYVKGE